jgi:sugar lactone lactonase YvrE
VTVEGSVRVDGLVAVGKGIRRPEDVHVTPDGRVFASDADAAISEIRPDGTLRRIGAAGGEPNGFALLPDDSAVIANFALGVLQHLDLTSGSLTTILDRVEGEPLGAINYPLVDSTGAIWASSSARRDPVLMMATGEADGFILRVSPGGGASIVVPAIAWPNCMTFADDEQHLYVCRSAHADVVRLPVIEGQPGAPVRYGPQLGNRRDAEFGPELLEAFAQPETMRRWAFTDGCAFDAEGNLWVTLMTANRVVVVSPDGDVTTVVDDPAGRLVASPTSIAFGGPDGRDVYFGSISKDYVVKGRSSVAGQNVVGRTSASIPPSTTRKLPTT